MKEKMSDGVLIAYLGYCQRIEEVFFHENTIKKMIEKIRKEPSIKKAEMIYTKYAKLRKNYACDYYHLNDHKEDIEEMKKWLCHIGMKLPPLPVLLNKYFNNV